jgi:hypothetical protein
VSIIVLIQSYQSQFRQKLDFFNAEYAKENAQRKRKGKPGGVLLSFLSESGFAGLQDNLDCVGFKPFSSLKPETYGIYCSSSRNR